MPDLGQLQRNFNFLGLGAVKKEESAVKIGVLGASQVATYALINPSKRLANVDIIAVAARDSKRASTFAKQYGISKSYGSYADLLNDPDVDAVYIGLPNGLHGTWAKEALLAGKHVLCEKPICANAEEARDVQKVAQRKKLLCREAFHYREHPLMQNLQTLLSSGTLGTLQRVDVKVLIPKWVFGGGNIRWQENLAGGAMMDAGCYCANVLRTLTRAQPKVTSAASKLRAGSSKLDGAMIANVKWPSLPQLTGQLHASLQYDGLFPVTDINVEGTKGSLLCKGFIVPFFGHKVELNLIDESGKQQKTVEQFFGSNETTYYYQLDRFVTDLQVLQGHSTVRTQRDVLRNVMKTDKEDCISNMQLIDDVYKAAGLPIRSPTPRQT